MAETVKEDMAETVKEEEEKPKAQSNRLVDNVKEEEEKPKVQTSRLVDNFIAGGFGGVLCVLVGHPFDTIKVRLQTDVKARTTLQCAKDTFRRDGITGFYRGMTAPLCTVVPIFAISFMGFNMGKTIVSNLTDTNEQDFKTPHTIGAGMFSGVLTTVIMAPGERIKCILQIAGQRRQRGPKKGLLTVVKESYIEGGLLEIYRGSAATLLRDIPSTAAYFATYNTIMNVVIRNMNIDPCSNVTHLITMGAGGCAGLAFWLVGMPADVLKSRVQTAPTGKYPYGVRSAVVVLLKNDGPLALYRGLLPTVLRAFPANAATFLGFELMISFINWMKGISTCR